MQEDYAAIVAQVLAVLARELAFRLTSSPSRESATGPGRTAADPQTLLKELIVNWDSVYRERLDRRLRTKSHELLELRNRWAHHEPLTWDDGYRAVESASQLLKGLGAEGLSQLDDLKRKLFAEVAPPTPGVEWKPSTGLRMLSSQFGWAWVAPDGTGEALRVCIQCPTCRSDVQLSGVRNPQALSEKHPAFLLVDAAEPAIQVGQFFVGTHLQSPTLYYGAVTHCGTEYRLKVFFNRHWRSFGDPLLSIARSAGGGVK